MPEWAKSLWDTPEGLARVFYWTQWAIAVFGIITAASVVLSVVVSKKRDDIIALNQEQSEHRRDEQIAAANDAARKAREAQEQAEAKIARLEEATADRHLTPTQKELLGKMLNGQPAYAIVLEAVSGVADARRYATEIADVLISNGWNVQINTAIISGRDLRGIQLNYSGDETAQNGAALLRKAFAAAAIKIDGDHRTEDRNVIRLFIWGK